VRHVLEHYEPPLLALYRAHAREGPVLRVRALVALLRGHGLIGGAASRNPPHPPPPNPTSRTSNTFTHDCCTPHDLHRRAHRRCADAAGGGRRAGRGGRC
jgi:hypothetical protein